MAKTMAEVLAEHRYRGGSEPRACRCGQVLPLDMEGNLADTVAAHQAAALSAAGYGLVADAKRSLELAALLAYAAVEASTIEQAKAEAWDEGATAGLSWDENRESEFTTPNPYRAAEMRQG